MQPKQPISSLESGVNGIVKTKDYDRIPREADVSVCTRSIQDKRIRKIDSVCLFSCQTNVDCYFIHINDNCLFLYSLCLVGCKSHSSVCQAAEESNGLKSSKNLDCISDPTAEESDKIKLHLWDVNFSIISELVYFHFLILTSPN